MHLEISCKVSIGIHINLLLSLRRGGAMNGYLGLELRVHTARVDHIVSNKVRWIFILAILVHVARRCNTLTLKNLRREVFPAIFISRIEVLPLILCLYSCVRPVLKRLLTCITRSFGALRKTCTRCEDLRVGWSIWVVVIDCILHLIVIAHCKFDWNFTFFLAILLGRPRPWRRWIEPYRRCWHFLPRFAVLCDRISVPSWATTVGEAKWWAACWHILTIFIHILHVRVNNCPEGWCVAKSTRILDDSLVPVFILLLRKLLLSACTDSTFSFELQLSWISSLVFIVCWRWFFLLPARTHLVWATTWISSACVMRKSIIVWLSEHWVSIGTFAAHIHIASRGDHHALHSIYVWMPNRLNWTELFLSLCAASALSMWPLEHLHVAIAHIVLLLMYAWPRHVTWVCKRRVLEHLSDTLGCGSETLINSTGVWQSSYLYQNF